MHELSIAQDILEIVRQYVPENRARGVMSIRVRVGPLSGVVPECLEFSFGAIVAGTPWQGARLNLQQVPACLHCSGCKQDSEVRELAFSCPACGSTDVRMASGTDLQVVEIETEES